MLKLACCLSFLICSSISADDADFVVPRQHVIMAAQKGSSKNVQSKMFKSALHAPWKKVDEELG